MSLQSERFPDERHVRDIDVEDLLRRARGGTLLSGRSASILELRKWRGYLIGQADDLVAAAATESRSLGPSENRAVGEFIEDAEEIRVVVEELEAAIRKELSDPANLTPISPRYS